MLSYTKSDVEFPRFSKYGAQDARAALSISFEKTVLNPFSGNVTQLSFGDFF